MSSSKSSPRSTSSGLFVLRSLSLPLQNLVATQSYCLVICRHVIATFTRIRPKNALLLSSFHLFRCRYRAHPHLIVIVILGRAINHAKPCTTLSTYLPPITTPLSQPIPSLFSSFISNTTRYGISYPIFYEALIFLFLSSFNIGLPSHICSNVEYPYQKSLPPLTTLPYPHPFPTPKKCTSHSILLISPSLLNKEYTHNRHIFYIFIIFSHHDSFLLFTATQHRITFHHITSIPPFSLVRRYFCICYGYGHVYE